jgi:hypothetical protein
VERDARLFEISLLGNPCRERLSWLSVMKKNRKNTKKVQAAQNSTRLNDLILRRSLS